MSNQAFHDHIKVAILTLKDRDGSTPAAIKNYLATTHPDIPWDNHLDAALALGVRAGDLVKVRRV